MSSSDLDALDIDSFRDGEELDLDIATLCCLAGVSVLERFRCPSTAGSLESVAVEARNRRIADEVSL